jgi:lipopolysaccharide transport system permease protein
MTTHEALYTPDAQLGIGPRVWGRMLRELVRSRELTWRLLVRDLSARYRQSFLGYLWALAPALLIVVSFTYLSRSAVLPIAEPDIPYPAYVLLGVTVWQLFSTGLTASAQSLVGVGTFVTKINFSRESLVLAAFGQSAFDFLIRGILIVAVLAWFQVVPKWTAVLAPFLLVPLALLTIGLGFIFALANGVFRDIGNALAPTLAFAMFLSPIVYPPPTVWPHVLVNYANPVSPFIIATHDLLARGTLTQPGALALASVCGLLVFLAGWRTFHLAMPRVIERL